MSKEVVFKTDNHGEVGRQGGDWYSISAGHFLCVELGKEIVRLRQLCRDAADFVRFSHVESLNVEVLEPNGDTVVSEREVTREELAETLASQV